jgi:hypothetical protein
VKDNRKCRDERDVRLVPRRPQEDLPLEPRALGLARPMRVITRIEMAT